MPLRGTMADRISSRVVLVTGGATGIGAAVARRAIAEGAAVVIAGRHRDVGQRRLHRAVTDGCYKPWRAGRGGSCLY
jgi:NAD(P)-dependent dehydrogenase (short-subunit alcohol dehydrogenase family)